MLAPVWILPTSSKRYPTKHDLGLPPLLSFLSSPLPFIEFLFFPVTEADISCLPLLLLSSLRSPQGPPLASFSLHQLLPLPLLFSSLLVLLWVFALTTHTGISLSYLERTCLRMPLPLRIPSSFHFKAPSAPFQSRSQLHLTGSALAGVSEVAPNWPSPSQFSKPALHPHPPGHVSHLGQSTILLSSSRGYSVLPNCFFTPSGRGSSLSLLPLSTGLCPFPSSLRTFSPQAQIQLLPLFK